MLGSGVGGDVTAVPVVVGVTAEVLMRMRGVVGFVSRGATGARGLAVIVVIVPVLVRGGLRLGHGGLPLDA
jgi:hypothetical protein